MSKGTCPGDFSTKMAKNVNFVKSQMNYLILGLFLSFFFFFREKKEKENYKPLIASLFWLLFCHLPII